jgi:hypothetical protein
MLDRIAIFRITLAPVGSKQADARRWRLRVRAHSDIELQSPRPFIVARRYDRGVNSRYSKRRVSFGYKSLVVSLLANPRMIFAGPSRVAEFFNENYKG